MRCSTSTVGWADVGPVLDAGAAWFERSSRVGVVRACFSAASYVDFGGDLLAVCQAWVPSGPLHLRLASPPPWLPGCASTSTVDPGRRWAPAVLDAGRLVAWRDLSANVLAGVRSPFDDPLTSDVVARLDDGDLAGVARRIGGRGPGLDAHR